VEPSAATRTAPTHGFGDVTVRTLAASAIALRIGSSSADTVLPIVRGSSSRTAIRPRVRWHNCWLGPVSGSTTALYVSLSKEPSHDGLRPTSCRTDLQASSRLGQ
jgi:hypothetical protein